MLSNEKQKSQLKYCSDSIKLFDIAANLSDEKFKGVYNGKTYHEDDTLEVIDRAKKIGVKKMLFAAGCLEDAHESYKLAQLSNDYYITVGVHPCRANEPDKYPDGGSEGYHKELVKLFETYKDKIIAIGECGLDYDRFHYAVKEDQMKQFPVHFDYAKMTGLPMYLHSRNTGGDFLNLVKENRHKFSTGVVHSFTESAELMFDLCKQELYIGVNGCSLKTQENMDVVKQIPLDRIMLETDAPYCDIKSTHTSFKLIDTQFDRVKKEKMKKGQLCKDRNEPCMIVQVLEVVAKLKNIDKYELAKHSYENTLKCFNLKDD